jgi:propionyl-CoA synthetase
VAEAEADGSAYWARLAREFVSWKTPFTTALDAREAPFYKWFEDGTLNVSYNCLDRHVEAGRGARIAIRFEADDGAVTTVSYADLLARTCRLANALVSRGVRKGDRVVIYMSMVPEALVAMLACARLGAIHSVVFGGFAAPELAVRIDDAKPKAVIATSCGIEPGRIVAYKPLLDAALEIAAHAPDFCVIFQREQGPASLVEGRDVEWHAFQENAAPADCVPVGGMDPLYVLYTSGTTGQPKGVVRPNAGHMVALAWSMTSIYDVAPGDVFWAASDVGWVVGHSYICYAPLLVGATTIVFEGKPVGTPDAGTFWRVLQDHRVGSFFTAPTAFRAIKREDPEGRLLADYDLGHLRYLFLAGERADPDTIEWLQRHAKVPVIDHWWQTETGWPIAANPAGVELLPVKLGSPTVAMPGYDVRILSETGEPLPAGELGAVAIRLPLPPGTLPTLWNAESRFVRSYLTTYPGYYETGDAGLIDEDGYLSIMARTDDVINVAGHRLSTGAMEEVLASHPDVAECAVIGVDDALKGQLPVGFLCLNKGCARDHAEIVAECIRLVRDRIGPVAAFREAVVVERLPKTRSGKILRAVMGKIADGKDWKMPATIDDPAILGEIGESLTAAGFPRG